ncbi:DUF134 domain-containing protein [Prolixibacteraceae bacterium JC049]|nr:DUF134 domain-containing protein [Prolixibacteraceae bacterium JC049]
MRKVVAPPLFKGYKPFGSRGKQTDAIELNYEEYEALKLADYDLMNHAEASELMGVSRATFARIYETARRKIAKAFVECKSIKTVYGNATLDGSWFECKSCDARFTIPEQQTDNVCPMCSNPKIESLETK